MLLENRNRNGDTDREECAGDLFPSGPRLDPAHAGRPDPRPSVREHEAMVGELRQDFDFIQPSRSLRLLPVHPETAGCPVPTQAPTPTAAAASFQEGAWSLRENLAHLAIYDERLAIPVLEDVLAGGDGRGRVRSFRENQPEFVAQWKALQCESTDAILARLRRARERQVEVVRSFAQEQFDTPCIPLWGMRYGAALHSPAWIATKSYQHTFEHGNSVLRVALFWPEET